LVAVSEEGHTDGIVPEVQVPSQNETVAGVVAFSTANDDWPGDAESLETVGNASAGVFHQDETRHPVLFDRQGVEFTRLDAVERREIQRDDLDG